VSQLRCAIYARYSTDKQNPLSIDDQIRKCREFAARNAWEVLDAHLYSDEAISGATDDRSGLQSLSRRPRRPRTLSMSSWWMTLVA
jgi:site-specific DNA recombinase